MATVNFSVPDQVKEAFNATFCGMNKSAIVAELMLEAIERVKRKQQSDEAISRILARRQHAPVISEQALRSARRSDRP